MKRVLLLLVLALPLFAQEEDPELAELLAVIENETAIATKTRMNSDYVPGIVTVLEAEELEALGFHTVWEALAMVPGVQPVRDTPALGVILRRVDAEGTGRRHVPPARSFALCGAQDDTREQEHSQTVHRRILNFTSLRRSAYTQCARPLAFA